jgi:hypothetical protein
MGIWELQNDTLKLFVNGSKEGAAFLLKKNDLIPADQKFNVETGLIFCFAYLEKINNKNDIIDQRIRNYQY